MAKFSFHKEVWLLKDTQWLSDRKLAWEPIEYQLLCESAVNKNQISAMRRYFIKGEWTEGSEYAPSLDTRMRWCPTISRAYFDEMVSEAKTQYATQYLRETLVKSVMKVVPEEFMPLDDWHRRLTLYQWVVDNEVEYTNKQIEFNSFQVRAFPLETSKANRNDFSKLYFHWVADWLYTLNSNQYQGFIILLPFWFTSLRHMDESIFEWDQNVKTVNQLFLYIRNFIPEHSCHASSQAKKEFVTEFLKCVEKYGLSLAKMTELWKATAQNKEDEWVDKKLKKDFSLTLNCIESEHKPALLSTFISKFDEGKDPMLSIYTQLKNTGFCQHDIDYNDVKLVGLESLMTTEFKSEAEKEYAYHYCFEMTPKYIGTDRTTLFLNVFVLPKSRRVILTESSIVRNGLYKARIFNANRLFILDLIRIEEKLNFSRYINYTGGDEPKTIPPSPEDYLSYRKLKEIPFMDKNYSIFRHGRYGLLHGTDDQFTEVEGPSYSDFISNSD
jgi:hypothetical protein